MLMNQAVRVASRMTKWQHVFHAQKCRQTAQTSLIRARSFDFCHRFYCSSAQSEPTKLSLFQKLKMMYKDYWYVTVPVHVATSCVWFGGFYEVAASGMDFKKYMKWFGFSDTVVEKVAGSGAGNIAIAYALYKVATPARYAVTIGCSTYAINFLKTRGYIRTAKQISQPARDMMKKKKEEFLKRAKKEKTGD